MTEKQIKNFQIYYNAKLEIVCTDQDTHDLMLEKLNEHFKNKEKHKISTYINVYRLLHIYLIFNFCLFLVSLLILCYVM